MIKSRESKAVKWQSISTMIGTIFSRVTLLSCFIYCVSVQCVLSCLCSYFRLCLNHTSFTAEWWIKPYFQKREGITDCKNARTNKCCLPKWFVPNSLNWCIVFSCLKYCIWISFMKSVKPVNNNHTLGMP